MENWAAILEEHDNEELRIPMKAWLSGNAIGSSLSNKIALIFSPAGSALISLWLGQSLTWDQFNYHYYCGYALLTGKFRYDFAPAQVQSFFNPLIHVPTYLILHYLPAKGMALILGALQGLNFWLVYRLSKLLFARLEPVPREGLSLIISSTAFYGAANLSELGNASGDNITSLLLIAAVTCILRLIRQSGEMKTSDFVRLAFAGFSCGAATSLKLSAAIYVLPLAGIFGLASLILLKRVKPGILFGAGILAGFLVTYGFWGTYLYRSYGNPFYPNFNNLFHSKYYDYAENLDPRFLPRNLGQTLFYPFYLVRKNVYVGEYIFRSSRLALCYLMTVALAIGGVVALWRRNKAWVRDRLDKADLSSLILLTLFLAGSYVLWQRMFSIYRYTVTLELLAPVFLSLGWMAMVRRQPVFISAAILSCVFIIAREVPLDFGRQPFVENLMRVRPPAWEGLDRSVVVMAGMDPYSYIIPSFPESTRFVRVESNFIYPGRNYNLDEKIGRILSAYDENKTLAYLYAMKDLPGSEKAFRKYGVSIRPETCEAIQGYSGPAGFLCRTRHVPGSVVLGQEAGPPRIEVNPRIAKAGIDTVVIEVFNLNGPAMDIRYTIDGREMPPIRNWQIGEDRKIRVFLSRDTKKGLYRYTGIRPSNMPEQVEWTEIHVEVLIQ